MSRKEIITKHSERFEVPLEKYHYPPEEGSFIGTLTYRAWHYRSPCLVCYFDTDCGNRYRLMAWFNYEYSPRKSGISFADEVVNGTRWKCEVERSKNGSMTWLAAEKIEVEV